MRIFALETDRQKLTASFLSTQEEIILHVSFSGFLFAVHVLKAFFFTACLVAVGVGLGYTDIPTAWIVWSLIILWIPFIGWPLVTSYIDWRFDFLLLTTEEIVLVDQSSLFRQKIRQMNLDNVASVSSETQFLNMFPFGKLHFELKEGVGKAMNLAYIPHAQKVASLISDAIVIFQRRRAALAQAALHGVDPSTAMKAAAEAAPLPST